MSETWTSPLAERYASPAMQRLFGAQHRFGLWRRLWLALAEACAASTVFRAKCRTWSAAFFRRGGQRQ